MHALDRKREKNWTSCQVLMDMENSDLIGEFQNKYDYGFDWLRFWLSFGFWEALHQNYPGTRLSLIAAYFE